MIFKSQQLVLIGSKHTPSGLISHNKTVRQLNLKAIHYRTTQSSQRMVDISKALDVCYASLHFSAKIVNLKEERDQGKFRT